MSEAKLGDRVRVQYCLVTNRENEAEIREIADVATGGHPGKWTCEFTAGGAGTFTALSLGVVGMKQGDTKRIIVHSAEAPRQYEEAIHCGDKNALAGKAIELDVLLMSLDASSNANQRQPQFDLGGES